MTCACYQGRDSFTENSLQESTPSLPHHLLVSSKKYAFVSSRISPCCKRAEVAPLTEDEFGSQLDCCRRALRVAVLCGELQERHGYDREHDGGKVH